MESGGSSGIFHQFIQQDRNAQMVPVTSHGPHTGSSLSEIFLIGQVLKVRMTAQVMHFQQLHLGFRFPNGFDNGKHTTLKGRCAHELEARIRGGKQLFKHVKITLTGTENVEHVYIKDAVGKS
jgi:hypothetical protein